MSDIQFTQMLWFQVPDDPGGFGNNLDGTLNHLGNLSDFGDDHHDNDDVMFDDVMFDGVDKNGVDNAKSMNGESTQAHEEDEVMVRREVGRRRKDRLAELVSDYWFVLFIFTFIQTLGNTSNRFVICLKFVDSSIICVWTYD